MNICANMIQIFVCAALLGGCGTYVPSIRTIPTDDPGEENDMVATVIRSINCELSYTVTKVILNDQDDASRRPNRKIYAGYLRDWGAEVAINFTTVERSSFNPTLLLTPMSSASYVFTASGGLTVSSDANRIQKTNIFYTIAELYKPDVFNNRRGREVCRDPTGNKEGSPLVDIDLKLFSLLESRIASAALGSAKLPSNDPTVAGLKNVLNQTISFKITSSGNLTPSWKLVPASFNSSGTFFSTGRDNTHELVFTFGPLDKSVPGIAQLSPLAEATHTFTQLQNGLQNNLLSGYGPNFSLFPR